MSTFSKRLKNLRKDKRLTQKQLGELLFIDDTSISKYENEKAMPENELLQRIADFFEVSVDYLLGRIDDQSPPTRESKPELTKKEQLDIEKEALQMIKNIDSADVIEFCGTPADDDDKEFLRMAYERFLSDVRVYNKMKYTPKKYKK